MMDSAGELGVLPVSTERAELGESPVWSEAEQAVWWVDITGRKLFRTTLLGSTTVWDTPELIGFVELAGGTIWVGMQSGLFRFDPSTGEFTLAAPIPADGQRFNDACTDDQGRIWAGTMDFQNTRPVGVLYLFDPAVGTLTRHLEGLLTVNGLVWDADKRFLYVSDSHPSVQTVWRCTVPAGISLDRRDVFARFHDLKGRPDGAALDRSGNYWIAGVGGGALYRFDRSGTGTSFALPLSEPTKPAFVGTNFDRMVITSKADDGLGGRLCEIDLGDLPVEG